MAARTLAGCTIVVTRPAGQSESLLTKLTQSGALPVAFPVMDIQPVTNNVLDDTAREQVRSCDLAIFISRNAVIHGLPVIEQAGGFSPSVQIATVGRGTANELDRHGVHADLLPAEGASSEALLAALNASDIHGKQVLIIRGVGGRELLADSLRSSGARVDYLECYRRVLPDTDPHILSQAWETTGIHAIIVTSLEGLRNLEKLVQDDDRERLRSIQLYVVSTAMVELCADRGYNLKPILMNSPSDDDVMAALQAHCDPRHPAG